MSAPVPANETWKNVLEQVARIREETARVIVGQQPVVEQMLTALLCRGHCLLVGVPGLAKTLLVSTLGKILGLKFHRIQFTPDLMPTDIVGSELLMETEGGGRSFQFAAGPIFTNLLLADEINRTPPKTQAALLEAMQEKQVTVAGKTRALEEPFLVFATQNPIEHEGTYPLPEAQLDRFFFMIKLDYPSMAEEAEVLVRTTGKTMPSASTVLDAARLIALQDAVLDMPVPDHVTKAVLHLTHMSRPDNALADDFVKNYVAWGAGPRASQSLVRASRALALLRGQSAASLEEVKAVAAPVLRHRVLTNYNATGDNITVEKIVEHLVAKL
jgi:MoxR-like ATPase